MATRRTHYGVSLLLVHLLLGCTPSSPAGDPPASNAAGANVTIGNAGATASARLVVAFGDSLYAGYQLAPNAGFAPALERELDEAGIDARVVNAGVSGDTSAAGLQRLAFTLDGLPTKPDLVIVGLGGNDMLRGLPPAETRANLDAILAELARRKIPAMLTGMLAAPNMGKDYATAFNAIYAELAGKYDVPLYPFFLDGVIGRRELMLTDGIHPNAKGVDVIADALGPAVANALED